MEGRKRKRSKEGRRGGNTASVSHACASTRAHLPIRKRTRQTVQAGQELHLGALCLAPGGSSERPGTGLACPPLQTCSSLGPSQRPCDLPSLQAWGRTLTVGTTDVRRERVSLHPRLPGLKSTCKCERRGWVKGNKLGAGDGRQREEKTSAPCADHPWVRAGWLLSNC